MTYNEEVRGTHKLQDCLLSPTGQDPIVNPSLEGGGHLLPEHFINVEGVVSSVFQKPLNLQKTVVCLSVRNEI